MKFHFGPDGLLADADTLSRFVSMMVWAMGWMTTAFDCPACGHRWVLCRPVGPTFDDDCPECGMKVGDAPVLEGDGLWLRMDPQPHDHEFYDGADTEGYLFPALRLWEN